MRFDLKLFKVDDTTNFTRLAIVYDFGKGPEYDERGFAAPEMAKAYIGTMRRDYLKKMVELYVHHAKHIFEKSRLAYYTEPNRVAVLQRCLNAVKVIAAESSTKVVCGYIASSANLFKNILPLPSNPSYESSEERLTVMLQIAKEYLIAEKPKLTAKC